MPDPTELSGVPAAQMAAALVRIHERFGATPAAQERLRNPYSTSPVDAVRLVTYLAGGTVGGLEDEPPIAQEDLLAALSLMAQVRADIDDLEVGLLTMARAGGATWPEVAHALGLRTAQAAQQRTNRLRSRLGD